MEEWREELAEIRAIMKENAKGFTELTEQQKKNEEENAKGFAELRELQRRNEEEQKKTDEQMKKTDEKLDKLIEQVTGIGDGNGKFSETYFYNSLFNSMSFGGKEFDEIEKGMKRAKKMPDGKKLKGEYDVIMYNGDTVALIEIKYKVRKDDIETLADKQVNVFRQLFPQYAKHKFYLGIAGMSFEGSTESDALKRGIGIMRPKGENIEILDDNLKVY
jgi:hypothetical protein